MFWLIPPIWCCTTALPRQQSVSSTPTASISKELPSHIRSFEQAVAYWPNQVYIGNKTPDDLAAVPQPWCDKDVRLPRALRVSSAR